MNPLLHLIITLLACILLYLLISFPPFFILLALLLTLLVDFADHSLVILFWKGSFLDEVRAKIYSLKLKEAYSFYYNGRKKHVRSMLLHNLIFLLLAFLGAFLLPFHYMLSAQFGVTLHFITDICENIRDGSADFWFGRLKSIRK
ncbi:MAG: hypothetical protein ABIH99_01605 [Candidatus Micrarchaeota archaeon]